MAVATMTSTIQRTSADSLIFFLNSSTLICASFYYEVVKTGAKLLWICHIETEMIRIIIKS